MSQEDLKAATDEVWHTALARTYQLLPERIRVMDEHIKRAVGAQDVPLNVACASLTMLVSGFFRGRLKDCTSTESQAEVGAALLDLATCCADIAGLNEEQFLRFAQKCFRQSLHTRNVVEAERAAGIDPLHGMGAKKEDLS